MKKILSILLAFCLVFSLAGTAFAAKSCSCGHAPVIYVRGFGAPLYESQTNEKIYPPEKNDFIPVLPQIIGASLALVGGFYRPFATLAMQAAEKLFEKLPCDETGTPICTSNIHDMSLPSSDTHKSGDLWSYVFPYDWREDPMEIAQQLNDYVERVKELTGHSKVSFICHSMGSVMFAAYLAQYGSDSVDTVVFEAPAFQGVSIMGSLLSGEADIGNKNDELTYFLQSVPKLSNAGLKLIFRILGKYGAFKYVLQKRLQPALDAQFVNVFNEFLRPTFAQMPGLWSFVSDQYYERAKAFSFGSDPKYAELIRKIDRYHYDVQVHLTELLTEAQENGMKLAIISGFGISSMPLSREHTMQADILITTANSSIGATCAPFGETLPSAYVQAVNDGHDHISADRLVDASTCAFPEYTWFVRDLMHFDFPYENDGFVRWLLSSQTQPTVQMNAQYPQFMRQVGEDLQPVIE